jgi:hypothetical protein
MLGDKSRRALRPDAQPFDEVRMVTVPRYKTSGLSGDEWRISVRVQFYRKGKLIFENSYSKMEYAVRLLDRDYIQVSEGGGAFYAGEGTLCDQEGCANEATVTYHLKKEYCRSGHGEEVTNPTVRLFCDKHKTRGDCGLEDADANYTEARP